MTDDEAQSTGEFQMRHSHATHDLFNAIADGDFPKYDFSIQTMDPADEMSFDFDPLDCTKVIFSSLPHLSWCTSLTHRQRKTALRICLIHLDSRPCTDELSLDMHPWIAHR